MDNEAIYERLVNRIHSAVESEMPEPREFKPETESRLKLVYTLLRDALSLPPEID